MNSTLPAAHFRTARFPLERRRRCRGTACERRPAGPCDCSTAWPRQRAAEGSGSSQGWRSPSGSAAGWWPSGSSNSGFVRKMLENLTTGCRIFSNGPKNRCRCRHLLRRQSEESVGLIQDQVVEADEQEAAAGEQTRQSEGRGHQQQAWRG